MLRQALKNTLKSWRQSCGCIPPEQDPSFVRAMKDVLEVYQQMRSTIRFRSVSMKPPSNIFSTPLPRSRPVAVGRLGMTMSIGATVPRTCSCACPEGRQAACQSDRHRRKEDFARVRREIADVHFPNRQIALVMDNRNTHRLASRLAIHYAPKHGAG